MKTTIFTSMAEIFDEPNPGDSNNPLLKMASFVFADDKGNSNKQGIKEEDFDAVIASALHTPVKMKLVGRSVEGHAGSVPIGHIKRMTKRVVDGVNQLFAEAILYAQEFPKEIAYLEKKYSEGEAPGISYELLYSESAEEDGIEWLKNIIVRAATFVRNPAYGTRTALLAIASDESLDDDALVESVTALAADWASKNTAKGGRNVELEEALKTIGELREQLEKANAEVARLSGEVTQKDTALAEVTEKVTNLQTEIETTKRDALKVARVAKMTAAGYQLSEDEEAADKVKDYWLSFSEENFDIYYNDFVKQQNALAEAKTTKTTKTSTAEHKTVLPTTRTDRIPRLQADASKTIDVRNVRESFRGLARTPITAE